MPVEDDADPGFTVPSQVSSRASRREWRGLRHTDTQVTNRYDVIDALLDAGVDPDRIHMYHDDEGDGAYWIVSLDGGRRAVLTDDTEENVSHMEGPWPFKAMLLGSDGAKTVIDYSFDEVRDRFIAWCTGPS